MKNTWRDTIRRFMRGKMLRAHAGKIQVPVVEAKTPTKRELKEFSALVKRGGEIRVVKCDPRV